jgi:hypothetical protein
MNDPLYLPFEVVFLILMKLCHFINFYFYFCKKWVFEGFLLSHFLKTLPWTISKGEKQTSKFGDFWLLQLHYLFPPLRVAKASNKCLGHCDLLLPISSYYLGNFYTDYFNFPKCWNVLKNKYIKIKISPRKFVCQGNSRII